MSTGEIPKARKMKEKKEINIKWNQNKYDYNKANPLKNYFEVSYKICINTEMVVNSI